MGLGNLETFTKKKRSVRRWLWMFFACSLAIVFAGQPAWAKLDSSKSSQEPWAGSMVACSPCYWVEMVAFFSIGCMYQVLPNGLNRRPTQRTPPPLRDHHPPPPIRTPHYRAYVYESGIDLVRVNLWRTNLGVHVRGCSSNWVLRNPKTGG